MEAGKKVRRRNSIVRIALVGISLLMQLGWLLVLVLRLNAHYELIATVTGLISVAAVLRLYSRQTTSAMKMPWVVLILSLPVMGLCLYLLAQRFAAPRTMTRRLAQSRGKIAPCMGQESPVLQELEQADPAASGNSRYLQERCRWPVYRDTAVTYYPQAAQAYEAMLRDLEQAERFIFMEYFIIEDAQSFDALRQILARKASQGVQVRIMYDDVGSVGYLQSRFARQLRSQGLDCRVFGQVMPVLNLYMNYRDHRKITVIDGKVGFTGGYNLAGEYFGVTQPFGHWKDTGLRLEGPAVQSLTATFLELWNLSGQADADVAPFLQPCPPVAGAKGFAQPFADDPLGQERMAENVLLNLIGSAQKEIWFMTPYLIITEELNRALALAAGRGVDVRILTPGIPDKKLVFQVTRSYYRDLARHGVRIFEYSPGFVHAKQCVCDGKYALVGTSNLDYRSLYHHFENNVLLADAPAVADIRQDFADTFPLCREMTDLYSSPRKASLWMWQCILRLFAPMM